MKKSFESRFPDHEGWLRCKLSLIAGHNLTEQMVKTSLLAGKPEEDYEIGHLSVGKTVARFIFRKKPIPNT